MNMHKYKRKRGRIRKFFLYNVPEIGVEPTRREALAPETSVSTISPLGLAKAGQRYKNLLIYELFYITISYLYSLSHPLMVRDTCVMAKSMSMMMS